MRLITFLAVLILCVGCSNSKKSTTLHEPSGPAKLNGTWVPIKEEMGGKALPTNAFATQKLIISDSNYTFIAESVDKGIIKYKNDKMDIYGEEGVNIGRHFTALFKYENELLTICYNLKGDSYPESFDSKAKGLLFLSVFKKQNSN